MKFILVAAAATALPFSAIAASNDQIAIGLGMVIASEELCGLSYNQDAIGAFISENVDPTDIGFSSTLGSMTRNATRQIDGMSQSAKTAHCASIAQSAAAFGFIE